MKFFSKSTLGFYDEQIHADAMPSDAVEITDTVYEALLSGQSAGKILSADEGGAPVLMDPPAPSADDLIKAQIEDLEKQQTLRRIREAIAGTDNGWLSGLEAQISILRTKLS